MKTSPFRALRAAGGLFSLVWLSTAPVDLCAQTFISATPQEPIELGQSLSIDIYVYNDSYFDWEPGIENAYSWFVKAQNASWPMSEIDYGTTKIVYGGAFDTMQIIVDSAYLPDSPGTYTIQLAAAYNWLDVLYYEMSESPKTVTFTIASANHAPVIAPIGDKIAVETNELSFQVVATDQESPPQKLSFELLGGAPPGAAIRLTNGLFTWTPPSGYGPKTNQLSVRVWDDGSPVMSDTNDFRIITMKPLQLLPPRLTNGVATLVWSSLPARTYRIRYRDNLSSGSWTNLSPDVLATGYQSSTTNRIGTAAQRYYQLMLVN